MAEPMHDIAKIMGVDEETVAVLPKIQYVGNMLNPWGDALLNVLRTLRITPGQTVLDMPCGQGGVAVRLAKECGAAVVGFDLLPGFVDCAKAYAAAQKVEHLCCFSAADIRDVTASGGAYDALLWVAPPHIWGDYAQTVENLRRCVKNTGHIVIADAYVYTDAPKDVLPGYETLAETLHAVTAHGDTIAAFMDCKGSLWADSYRMDRNAVAQAIDRAADSRERITLEKYAAGLDEAEAFDTQYLGLYILVLQIEKVKA